MKDMESAQKADTVFSGVTIERLLCLYHWPLVVSALHRESQREPPALRGLFLPCHLLSYGKSGQFGVHSVSHIFL